MHVALWIAGGLTAVLLTAWAAVRWVLYRMWQAENAKGTG